MSAEKADISGASHVDGLLLIAAHLELDGDMELQELQEFEAGALSHNTSTTRIIFRLVSHLDCWRQLQNSRTLPVFKRNFLQTT